MSGTEDLHEALEQILALAERAEHMSPPVTTIGHRDPWADVGKRAVKIARDVLEADE
jgi:hypothetical protein